MKDWNYTEWEAWRDYLGDMVHRCVVPSYMISDFNQIRGLVHLAFGTIDHMPVEIVDMINRTEKRFMKYDAEYQSLLAEELQRIYEDDTDPIKGCIKDGKIRSFGQ